MTAHYRLLDIDSSSPPSKVHSTLLPSEILLRDSFSIACVDSFDELHERDDFSLSLQELLLSEIHRGEFRIRCVVSIVGASVNNANTRRTKRREETDVRSSGFKYSTDLSSPVAERTTVMGPEPSRCSGARTIFPLEASSPQY